MPKTQDFTNRLNTKQQVHMNVDREQNKANNLMKDKKCAKMIKNYNQANQNDSLYKSAHIDGNVSLVQVKAAEVITLSAWLNMWAGVGIKAECLFPAFVCLGIFSRPR